MEVEYLKEYEKEIRSNIVNNTDLNSNNGMLSSQNQKTIIKETIINKEVNNLQELSNEKENIDSMLSADTAIQQLSKLQKSIKEVRIPLKNTNSCNRNYESKQKVNPIQKKGMISAKQKMQNIIEVSSTLNDVYEKTYELKKSYYEARLQYLKRSTEAREKIVDIMERCNIS